MSPRFGKYLGVGASLLGGWLSNRAIQNGINLASKMSPKYSIKKNGSKYKKYFKVSNGYKRGLKKLLSSKRVKAATKRLNKKIRNDGPISDSRAEFPRHGGATFLTTTEKHDTAVQSFVMNDSQEIDTVTPGLQIGSSNPTFLNALDVVKCYNQANVVGTTGGGSPATVYVKNGLTQKMLVETVHGELLISNQTNDPVRMYIYDCTTRRDLKYGSNYINPYVAWQIGCADMNLAAAYKTVGATPFECPGFTEYFLVEKRTEVNLHTGGHHTHSVHFEPQHVFSNEVIYELTNSGVNNASVGMQTRFCMIVIHGLPVSPTGGGAVTTNRAIVDVVWKQTIKYRILDRSTTQTSQANTLSTGVTPSIINDLTGVAVGFVRN